MCLYFTSMWIQVLILLITPIFFIWLATRWAFLEKIGVVTVCYILGVLVTNSPGIKVDETTSKQVIEIVVPLFLPLLLFNGQLEVWQKLGKNILISFLFCVLSVTVSAILATYLFKEVLPNVWQLSSMMIGVYTGGTPNLSAIGLSLDVSPEMFIVLNATDLLFGGTWLIFLLSFAKPFFSKILLPNTLTKASSYDYQLDEKIYPSSAIALLLSAGILGISLGISKLLHNEIQEITVILSISTLGIIASFFRPIRRLKGSYGMGNYLLLVFCLAVGSIADFSKIWDTGLIIVLFVGFVMLGSILIHLMLSYIFGIDVDTFLITSTAGIYGPAFIAPVARSIGNPLIIPMGIASALLGYGVANYVGISISFLLRYI